MAYYLVDSSCITNGHVVKLSPMSISKKFDVALNLDTGIKFLNNVCND